MLLLAPAAPSAHAQDPDSAQFRDQCCSLTLADRDEDGVLEDTGYIAKLARYTMRRRRTPFTAYPVPRVGRDEADPSLRVICAQCDS